MCAEDVCRCDDSTEAVVLGHAPTGVGVAAGDEDGFVFVVVEVAEGSVALYEHSCVELDAEFVLEVLHAVFFGASAAIGDENEWDILVLQVAQGSFGGGDGFGGADEDAIDAVDVVISLCRLVP